MGEGKELQQQEPSSAGLAPLTEVEIRDAEPNALKEFLKFIYTDEADLSTYDEELLCLAKKYQVEDLEARCTLYAENGLKMLRSPPTGTSHIPQIEEVLAASSSVFTAMLHFNEQLWQMGGQNQVRSKEERIEEVEVPDATVEVFQSFLTFLYTDEFPSASSDDDVIVLLNLARKYQVATLEQQCLSYMKQVLTMARELAGLPSAFIFLEVACLYEIKELEEECCRIIDTHTASVLQTPNFSYISHTTFCRVLARDTLSESISDYNLFTATLKWAEDECGRKGLQPTGENMRQVIGEKAFHLIRFPLMPMEVFAKHIVPLDILTVEERMEVFCHHHARTPTLFNTSPLLRMPIFVQVIIGERCVERYSTCLGTTVQSLKKEIPVQAGIAPSMQRLTFAGKQLEDNHTLGYYGLTHDCTLQLAHRSRI